jgi:hypothetical protein
MSQLIGHASKANIDVIFVFSVQAEAELALEGSYSRVMMQSRRCSHMDLKLSMLYTRSSRHKSRLSSVEIGSSTLAH